MLLPLLMAVTGACLGVLLAAASTPRPRVLPLVSVIALTFLAATIFVVIDPASLLSALLFVVAGLVTSVIYGGVLWGQALPELGQSLGWFSWMQFARPSLLRGLYLETQNTPSKSDAAHGEAVSH